MYPDDPTIESADSRAPISGASNPTTIGRFQVERLLGRGGMGEVFLARDPVLDRDVAVKLISGDLDSPKSHERLVREARAAGRLRHPNIVTIFDTGEHDGRPFIAMEFVRGETLGSLVRRQVPLSLASRLEKIEGACAGLAHAHRLGVVHLDIKPDNLMLDESGIVKVLDFGIARVLQTGLLVTRQLGGTLRYMSPEQIDGQPLDHRSDIFSLGCALFEWITFVPAFVGSTKDIVTQIANGPAPTLRAAIPEIDARLDAIVRRAMAVDLSQRYSSLDELRSDLAAARADMDPRYDPRVRASDRKLENVAMTTSAVTSQHVMPAPSSADAASTPRRRSLIAATVVTALIAAGVFWTFRQSGPAPSGPRDERLVGATVSTETTPAPRVPAAPTPADSPPAVQDEIPRGRAAGAPALPTPPREPQSTVVEQPAATANSSRETVRSLPVVPPIPDISAGQPVQPPPTSADNALIDPAPPTAVSPVPGAAAPTPIAEIPRASIRLDQDAVRDTLRRYEAAYRALAVDDILQVYPSLGRDQTDQLRRTFATVTNYELDFRNPQIDVQGDTATVRATLVRRITPRVGSPVANEFATEFRLRRAGGVWAIVAVAAR
jgi:serine/threonine-protein kinase